ncbi:D-alanyl-D-alanine carboxypeptidase [Kineococcus radiotolerans]|uniref:D-alanyl-D-alanine carboxypeptidase n=1 Tax=Kineococcus radiotolerans TaxID=131568 RepID=A0A7W4TL98_KINRA|nr:serine hydrolase domain-containing protein [Kineococcus radiotolerans]MBB2900998.1 D-alanyl-D-alanine carboxypeptidase [Kineococcus radiotolerans]
MPTTHRPARRTAALAAALLSTALIGTAATAGAAPPTATGATGAATTTSAAAGTHHRSPAVQRSLDALVRDDGLPGALAAVRERSGRVTDYTAGVRDVVSGKPIQPDSRIRIASNTKTFTATVVLQLVGEGEVVLDEPVETYLPGVVRGPGGDGRSITVRQLLQQTSGLPDYDTLVLGTDLVSVRHTYFEPSQLLQAALDQPASFAPGTRFEYSNTNYVVAGLLVQRVTGRPIGEQITERIIEPLHLRDTYWPTTGDQDIRGRHPQGYDLDTAATPVDVTDTDPSLGWAAGQLISTPSDLARFLDALVGGELLAPAELAQMRTTVPAPGFEPRGEWAYGLGLARTTLSCGLEAWGHGGDIQGFETRNLVTTDGRAAVVAVTALPRTLEAIGRVDAAVDTALCS